MHDDHLVYRRWLTLIATDPETFAYWMAQRPSDRILRPQRPNKRTGRDEVGQPKSEWRGKGSRRVRRSINR